MIKYTNLILLLLACLLLTGCISKYEQDKIDKVRAQVEIQKIKNRAELVNIDHEIRMMAAEIAADTQSLIKKTNVKLTKDACIINANHKAADALLRKLHVELAKDNPVLVASFVNIDDLKDSSTFGRTVSEHFASRFNQKGYTTIELKLRTNVFIRQGSGELMLSREVAEISTKHQARAVVVGTYAVASSKVYLTARVVNVADGRVLSSYDYSLPIGRNTFKMLLKGKGNPDWL